MHHPISEAIERWLAQHLLDRYSPSASPARVPRCSRATLLAAVRDILDSRPVLAQAARRLSTHEQLRLTLDLLEAATVSERHGVASLRGRSACHRRHRGRPRHLP